MFHGKDLVICGVAAALALSCGSQQSTTPPVAPEDDSFAQAQQKELESERQEFIRERRQQLDELDTEISRLEARLEHEGKLANAEEKAEWSQQLFELRQEHSRARAELDRASQVGPEEWKEMRGDLDVTFDALQASVSKAGSDIADLFRSAPSDIERAEVDLCEMQVEGADATIVEARDQLVVQLTTQDQDAVDELRQRAEKMAREAQKAAGSPQADTSPGAPSEGGATKEQSPLIASVSVENIEDGVRVLFTPAEGQRSALREQLESEVEQLQNERC
jgi:hypothetical protein